MSNTPFFRLLKTPIDDKGDALAAQIAALNATGQGEEAFTLDPATFRQIPGSPFAYWVGDTIRNLFIEMPGVQVEGRRVCFGLSTKDDFQFLRLHWEIESAKLQIQWYPFAKGGAYSPYYYDIHLVIDWENDGTRLKAFANRRTQEIFGAPSWSRWINNWRYYFRPGLTWPRRTTSGISIRCMPSGCIFADKGPAVFVAADETDELLALLAVMNASPFEELVKLQLGAATAAARSYEVGIIQRTPIPDLGDPDTRRTLAALTHEAHDLQRDRDRYDETTHAFHLPGLVAKRTAGSLTEAGRQLQVEEQTRQQRLAEIQAEIDNIVFDLYDLDEVDQAAIHAEMGTAEPQPAIVNLKSEVENLLMWAVGVAFGRWDVRMALDPTLLPALQGPFDPLPRCAPGALVGTDGLPPQAAADIAPEEWLRARENVLDLPASHAVAGEGLGEGVAWDGILVDDPTHPSDIVTRVRTVLRLLWGERADDIEAEACELLGYPDLRSYFRDPRKGFFAFHTKRYSKSRRKAPIYWLFQSEKRNYAIWLYIHRLQPLSLYVAGRSYADAKEKLETIRLEELRQGLDALSGATRRRRERDIVQQEKLVAEVTLFRKTLDRIALLNLPPDPNDGVVIGIAPLWELVPWKEAKRIWDKLVAGEYDWSTMSRLMKKKGLIP